MQWASPISFNMLDTRTSILVFREIPRLGNGKQILKTSIVVDENANPCLSTSIAPSTRTQLPNQCASSDLSYPTLDATIDLCRANTTYAGTVFGSGRGRHVALH
jgi:hypothetical protein